MALRSAQQPRVLTSLRMAGEPIYEDDSDADWDSSQFSRDGLPHGLQHGARIVPLDKELWALDSCTPCAFASRLYKIATNCTRERKWFEGPCLHTPAFQPICIALRSRLLLDFV